MVLLSPGDRVNFYDNLAQAYVPCTIETVRIDDRYDILTDGRERFYCVDRVRLSKTYEKKKSFLPGTRIEKLGKCGRVVKARDDDSVDVLWDDGRRSVAERTSELSEIRDADSESDDHVKGTRVAVRYTECEEYTGTIECRNRIVRKVKAGSAVPGVDLNFEHQNKPTYNVRYDDDGGIEKAVERHRIRRVLPDEDDFVQGDLHHRWCARRKTRVSKRHFQLGETVRVRLGDVWSAGSVTRIDEEDENIQVRVEDSGRTLRTSYSNVRSFNVEHADGKADPRNKREEENMHLVNVGSNVLVPYQRLFLPAKVIRCNLNGTVDVALSDREKNLQLYGVDPATFRRSASASSNDDFPWRLYKGQLVVVDPGSSNPEKGTIVACHANATYSIKLQHSVIKIHRSRIRPQHTPSPSITPHERRELLPAEKEWEIAVFQRAKAVLRKQCAGGDERKPLWRLSRLSENGNRIIDSPKLQQFFSKCGLALSDGEMAALAERINDGVGGEAFALEALSRFAGASPSQRKIVDYLTSRAAQALRRELIRCARRDGRPPNASASFAEIDVNEDGQIDRSEFARLMTSIGARLPHGTLKDLFDMLDTDANGSLSPEEFSTFVHLGYQSSEMCDGDGNILLAAAADEFRRLHLGDAKTDDDEVRRAFESAGWGELSPKARDVVSALDADLDGQVDADEMAAFLSRESSSAVEETRVLKEFRARLARWFDSPVSNRELRALREKNQQVSDARRDLEQLNLLGSTLSRRDVNVLVSCFAAKNVSDIVQECANWFAKALKGRWKSMNTARALVDVLNGLDLHRLRQLLVKSGSIATSTAWMHKIVPVFLKDASEDAISCAWKSMSRGTDRADLQLLLDLVDSEPTFLRLSRHRPSKESFQFFKAVVKKGSLVRVLRERKPMFGHVDQVRANGRFDITLRGGEKLLGVRQNHIRLCADAATEREEENSVATPIVRVSKRDGRAPQYSSPSAVERRAGAKPAEEQIRLFGGKNQLSQSRSRRPPSSRGICEEDTVRYLLDHY